MGQRTGAQRGAASRDGLGYLAESRRPLHILVFLLPLMIAYEVGAMLYLSGGEGQPITITARRMLSQFFETFGAIGLHLPGALLVTVLLIWHVLQKDPWKVRPQVILGMLMEACLWTVPLTILVLLSVPHDSGGSAQAGLTPLTALVQEIGVGGRSWQARLTIAAGAGLYEELLFRMIAMAAIHAVLVDLLRVSDRAGGVAAVVISAAAFALYHLPGGAPLHAVVSVLPQFVAGLYFGTVYLLRGFGLAVAVHFLYDVLALVVVGGGH